jgi:16S rRNA (cytidine1402-2'-O)-methyltransferase
MPPKLFLIPCPIGENTPIEMLPISIINTIIDIDFFIVEHEKEARRFIKKNLP